MSFDIVFFLRFVCFFIVLFFSVLFSYKDLMFRRIENIYLFVYFYFSLLIFMFNVWKLDWVSIFIPVVVFIIGVFMFNFGLIGGGDGKILISNSIILVSLFSVSVFLEWLILSFILYLFMCLVILFVYSNLSINFRVFKEYDFIGSFIIKVVFFIFFRDVLNWVFEKSFLSNLSLFIIFWIFVKFIFIGFISRAIRFVISNLRKWGRAALFISSLFVYFLFLGNESLIFHKSFLFFLFLSYFVYHISSVLDRIKVDGKKFYSPFVVYLMLSMVLVFVFYIF